MYSLVLRIKLLSVEMSYRISGNFIGRVGVAVGRSELCLDFLLGKLSAPMIFTGDEISGPFSLSASVIPSYCRNINLKT